MEKYLYSASLLAKHFCFNFIKLGKIKIKHNFFPSDEIYLTDDNFFQNNIPIFHYTYKNNLIYKR